MASEEDKDKKGSTSETPGQKLVSVPGSSTASSPSTANGTGAQALIANLENRIVDWDPKAMSFEPRG